MRKNTLWAISVSIDIVVLIGALAVINVVWPEDSWHRFVYYICGATFGGYVVFRYRQIRGLLQLLFIHALF